MEPTLVTFRVTVWTPARSPTAIDAPLKSLASVLKPAAVRAEQVAGPTALELPQRKASQSFQPLS